VTYHINFTKDTKKYVSKTDILIFMKIILIINILFLLINLILNLVKDIIIF